ncbi:hypothetical protein BV25DRAFT_1921216 [Artomyces pyxidatus]|uniref:Uncharacterized protein n=1 Tax=Artomyces pyxidatus TaxID=48021 RepID=A0ACB8SIT3_9AGAM|nr:hypothetical protein BV25DRAFT_1921216 [Artomyces pyxidatus]
MSDTSDHTPEIMDAAAPFNDHRADVILRSHDYMDFRVHKLFLSMASPVFNDILSNLQPAAISGAAMRNSDLVRDGRPVVKVTEDAKILDLVLRLCYPGVFPGLTEMDAIRGVLEACRKYAIEGADRTLAEVFAGMVDRDALGAFGLAIECGMEEVAGKAAFALLKMSLSTLVHTPLPCTVSGEQYRLLVQYHIDCGVAADGAVQRRESLDALADASPDLISKHQLCPKCFQSDMHYYYAPTYVQDYLHRIGMHLRVWPSAEQVLPLYDGELRIARAACLNCRKERSSGLAALKARLAIEVNAAVASVPVPKFL